jgi:molecular chaperone DnaK
MATYGIDLGTTNSCIASVDSSLRPVVLRSAQGDETTPSVVYFESPTQVVVGQQARESAVLAPKLVRERVKRDMGRDVRYSYHGQDYTPEFVSALILRELARAAQEQTGEAVQDVVITVPAYFGLREREATRKAGQIAGLKVLDVLEEPVAAALAYQSLTDDGAVRHIFVYDLGGGTFDTTVIRLDGHDVKVICVGGNHQLGGADWDAKIKDFLLRGFADRYPQLDPGGDEQFMQDLATTAEQLKKSLSAVMTGKRSMYFDGSALQLELTREHLEELTSELLEQTMDITEKTIALARQRGVERFDDVLLVGGMTTSPVVARTLRERFGLEARHQDPHLAVAKGAALHALTQKVRVILPDDGQSEPSVQDIQEVSEQLGISPEDVREIIIRVKTVVPRAFGLKVTDHDDPLFTIDPSRAREYITHLLTANTPLPADTGWRSFSTVAENQSEVRLEVWEQAGSVVSEELQHNTHIGQGLLSDLPPRPAGTPFEVSFHMTDTGTLQVHGREAESGSSVRFEIEIGALDAAATDAAAEAMRGIEVTG